MQLYNCTVRLNNSLTNHVFKYDVTAAEIAVLRHIHGQSEGSGDPVINIEAFDWVSNAEGGERYKVPKGTANRTDSAEKARLAAIYSMGEIPGSQIVKDVLGAGATAIPHTIEGVEVPDDETPKPARAAIPIIEPTQPAVRAKVQAVRGQPVAQVNVDSVIL